MNNTEEQHPVFIPRNFIEKGPLWAECLKSVMPSKAVSWQS